MDEDNTNFSIDNVSVSAFNRKRARDDSGSDSPESKLARVGSPESKLARVGSPESKLARVDSPESKLARVDSLNSVASSSDTDPVRVGLGSDSPDPKWIQDDLLYILDDSDEPAIPDLDSVMRSFEEEILVPATEVTSFTGEAQPDLGYLLEASDDELGLPPTCSSGVEEKVDGSELLVAETTGSGAARFAEMLGFEDGMPNYDSFEFGLGGGDSAVSGYSYGYNDAGDFVAVGGLFDYSDENCVPADISGLQWQPESLSAV